jgi:gas vesicle protein
MRRFIIGLLVLGAVVAVVAAIMKRRSGSEMGWDELAQDSFTKASDTANKAIESATDVANDRGKAMSDAATEAKDAATDAADKAADDISVVIEETERSAS